MKPVLLVEIVSACVALACLVALAIAGLRKGGRKRVPAWHAPVAITMCVAAAVHGVAAMAYGSGAPLTAYVLGWLATACFCASGVTMAPPVRARIDASANSWHVRLFVAGVALVVAHAVAGRL